MEQSSVVIGTAYYPEHWGRERWLEDLQLMQKAGITTLRLAELAWSRMEPEEGRYDLDWLEEFIDLAYNKAGMKIILGTPSEASPVWLRDKHPEVVRINVAGLREGGRGQHCHTSEVYRGYISRMAEQMVRRFANNPAVIGWQIDNELRGVACYCQDCARSFRRWLRTRYGTLDTLNREWGTQFWSQTYNTWDEICLPSQDQITISTSQVVDYKRFISDTTVDFLNMQVDIIKKYAPHQFVSHNALGSRYYAINMYDLAKKLDFFSWDSYPHVDEDYTNCCLGHDIARGTRHDNFWMLEQKNGYFNGSNYNLALEPGIARNWAYQDISRGANGVMFYRWRANRWGQEQNPNAILRHDGSPRRAYYEIQKLTGELAPFSAELAHTRVEAPVALLHNYLDVWAHEAKRQYTNISYDSVMMEYYRGLTENGVTADIVLPDDPNLSKYKIVLAPNIMLLSQSDADNLTRYVENGGHLVVGARAGMKNENNVVVDTPWPGYLAKLTGVTVDEFEAFPEHAWNQVVYQGKQYDARAWADVLTANIAEVEAVYGGKFYAGKPAITRNYVGAGSATYLGVAGSPELIKRYVERLLDECGIVRTAMPGNVYMTVRSGGGKRYAFVINMTLEPAYLDIPYAGVSRISGQRVGKSLCVKGMDTEIIECDPE